MSGVRVMHNVLNLIKATNAQIANAGGDSSKIERDPARYSWTRALLDRVEKQRTLHAESVQVVRGMYRPFCKQWLCYDAELNEMTYQQHAL